MTKRNYRQAKRQKEEARRMRQQQKGQRPSERATAAGVGAITESLRIARESTMLSCCAETRRLAGLLDMPATRAGHKGIKVRGMTKLAFIHTAS